MPDTSIGLKIQCPLWLLPVFPQKPQASPSPDAFIPELTQNEFEQKILKSRGRVLVMFSAPWCEPCQPLKHVVREAANIFRGALEVYQMDSDKMTGNFRKKWDPKEHLPFILLFDQGELEGTQAGASPLTGEEKKTLRFSPSSFEKNKQRLLKLIQTKLKIDPPK